MSVERRCVTCSLDLERRPCIMVEGFPNCFRCAKGKVGKLEAEFNEREKARFDAEVDSHKRWSTEFHSGPGFYSEFMPFPIYAAGIFIGFKLDSIVGAIVGGVLGGWLGPKLIAFYCSSFLAQHPKPPDPRKPTQASHVTLNYELVKDFGDAGTYRSNFRVRILMRDNNTCQNCCSQPGDKLLEVHHIQTRADNGPDHPANLITLCHSCHDREKWFGHVRAYPKTMS